MKIIDVQAIPLTVTISKRVPILSAPDRMAVVIKVVTDEGVTGVGECYGQVMAPAVCAIVDYSLKPLLLGQDPTNIERLWQRMYRGTFYYGREGIVMCAISGVEIALCDLVGRWRNIPVYQMLGGRYQDKVRAYASLPRYDTPEEVAEACARCVDQGYSAIKLHQIDVPSAKAARDAVGDQVDIMVDANCPWSPRQAIEMAKRFQEHNIFWLEEPVWPGNDYDGVARVKAAVDTPIAAGENEYGLIGFKEMITRSVVDIVQPSVCKTGGILESKKIYALANAWNLSVSPHCYYYGPGMAATIHLAMSSKECLFIETPAISPEEELLAEPLRPSAGYWEVSDKAGLGVDLNEEAIARYRFRGGVSDIPFWAR